MPQNVSSNSRECEKCGKPYLPKSNRQQYCVDCQKAKNRERCKARHAKTYTKRGYNQARENNNAWKGGVGSYKWFLDKRVCAWCGSTENLLTHHKDHNRRNNDLDNLVAICKKCHQTHHVKRDPVTGRFIPHT